MKSGQSIPLGKHTLRIIARLHHLHLLTHPARLALIFNITPEYVRRQFRELDTWEMAGILESLAAIGLNTQHQTPPTVQPLPAHETDRTSSSSHSEQAVRRAGQAQVPDRECEPRQECACAGQSVR